MIRRRGGLPVNLNLNLTAVDYIKGVFFILLFTGVDTGVDKIQRYLLDKRKDTSTECSAGARCVVREVLLLLKWSYIVLTYA